MLITNLFPVALPCFMRLRPDLDLEKDYTVLLKPVCVFKKEVYLCTPFLDGEFIIN